MFQILLFSLIFCFSNLFRSSASFLILWRRDIRLTTNINNKNIETFIKILFKNRSSSVSVSRYRRVKILVKKSMFLFTYHEEKSSPLLCLIRFFHPIIKWLPNTNHNTYLDVFLFNPFFITNDIFSFWKYIYAGNQIYDKKNHQKLHILEKKVEVKTLFLKISDDCNNFSLNFQVVRNYRP